MIDNFVRDYRREIGTPFLAFTGGDLFSQSIPVEGRLMAMTAYLAREWNMRMMPLAEVLARPHHTLDKVGLVIPDLNTSYRDGDGLDRVDGWKVHDLLQNRLDRRLPTIVYAWDPTSLSHDLAGLLIRSSRQIDLGSLRAKKPIAAEFPDWSGICAADDEPDMVRDDAAYRAMVECRTQEGGRATC